MQGSTFTENERVAWQSRYRGAESLLEYGAGESTRFACTNGTRVRTQESDPAWVQRLQAEPDVADAVAAGRCRLIHADVGPVENWGYPADETRRDAWPDYVLGPWRDGETFDLIMVDGRFRVACIAAALLHGRADQTIIVHDFWVRPHYHAALPFLDWVESADTLGVFTPRAGVDHAALEALLARYLADPE